MKERFLVLPSSPARCAEQLATGEADIGLIPSIEYQRIPDLQIIPGISVAARNEVRSVLLVQPRDAREIHSVALDTSSRTSVALLKLLLKMKLGREPRYEEHPPDLEDMLRRCDAALIIGDAALRLSPDEYSITDLAREWITWQQRPFVFAFWACRPNLSVAEDLVDVFHSAREWGLERREEIVTSFSRRLELPVPFLREYLVRNIDYDFGAKHLEGLERFFRLAFEVGLTPQNTPARFLALPVKSHI
jgi:chorismate dehydratase